MQLTQSPLLVVVLALLPTLTTAQTGSIASDVAAIPACALTCLTPAILSSGCGITDYQCQCTTGHNAILAASATCIQAGCSTDDAIKTQALTDDICKIVASQPQSSSAVVSSSSAPPASTAASVSSASSSAASSVSSVVSSVVSSAASSAASVASTVSSAASSSASAASVSSAGSSSATSAAPASSSSKAAAAPTLAAGGVLRMGAGVVGAAVVAAMVL